MLQCKLLNWKSGLWISFDICISHSGPRRMEKIKSPLLKTWASDQNHCESIKVQICHEAQPVSMTLTIWNTGKIRTAGKARGGRGKGGKGGEVGEGGGSRKRRRRRRQKKKKKSMMTKITKIFKSRVASTSANACDLTHFPQTRILQGLCYFHHNFETFETVFRLARNSKDSTDSFSSASPSLPQR